MKRKMGLCLLFMAAGGMFLFGSSTPQILYPRRAKAPQTAPAPTTTRGLVEVSGQILSVHPANKAKRTQEWIVLLVGKKRMSITVGAKATILNNRGLAAKPGILKPGETVSVSYRAKGKAYIAVVIRA